MIGHHLGVVHQWQRQAGHHHAAGGCRPGCPATASASSTSGSGRQASITPLTITARLSGHRFGVEHQRQRQAGNAELKLATGEPCTKVLTVTAWLSGHRVGVEHLRQRQAGQHHAVDDHGLGCPATTSVSCVSGSSRSARITPLAVVGLVDRPPPRCRAPMAAAAAGRQAGRQASITPLTITAWVVRPPPRCRTPAAAAGRPPSRRWRLSAWLSRHCVGVEHLRQRLAGQHHVADDHRLVVRPPRRRRALAAAAGRPASRG